MREPHALKPFALLALLLAAPLAGAHQGMVLLALDSGGSGNDLEPVNAVREAEGARRGNAMTFNGTTSYLTRVGQGTSMATQQFTICTWIKPTDARDASIVHLNGAIYLNQTGTRARLTWHFGTNAGANGQTLTVLSQENALIVGSWRHVCGRTEIQNLGTEQVLQLYVDGGLNAETRVTRGTQTARESNGPYYMGGVPTPAGVTNAFNGMIDDTVFCKSTLSTTNMNAIQNATSNPTGFCSGSFMAGWWKFDEITDAPPTTPPATGYIHPNDVTGEAPYARWMHVRGDENTISMRIDTDGDGVTDHVVIGNTWNERVTWEQPGTYHFHVEFIDHHGRAQHNETTITIRAPTSPRALFLPGDTTGGSPLTRLVTLEGDHRVVNIKIDFDGDRTYDREVNASTFAETYTWTTPGTYRLNVQYTNDANVSGYREAIITVTEHAAPHATIYPEPGTRGIAPMTRWIVVRGDPTVRTIRIDTTGDGTWDHEIHARSHNVQHTWDRPGLTRFVVQLENEHGTNGTYDIPLRIENPLFQDPLTSPRSCPFCGFGEGAGGFGGINPIFTPKQVWDWLVFLGLVAVGTVILWFRIARGQ